MFKLFRSSSLDLGNTTLLLNPQKFAFGVTLDKLLEYVVSLRVIKVNPFKIKEIQEMQPSKAKKKMRGLSAIYQSLHIKVDNGM